MVEVTEDDRRAYLSLNMLPEFDQVDVLAGRWDNVTGIQAFARHRQAGVQQGLDMAAAYLDGFKYNDIVMDGCTMRREWRKDFAAAIRKLGGDDGTD